MQTEKIQHKCPPNSNHLIQPFFSAGRNQLASSIRSMEFSEDLPKLNKNRCNSRIVYFFNIIRAPFVKAYLWVCALFSCCKHTNDPFESLRKNPESFISKYNKARIKTTNEMLDFIYEDPQKAAESCFRLLQEIQSHSQNYAGVNLNAMFVSSFAVFNRLKNDDSLELAESLFSFYSILSGLTREAGMSNPIIQAFSSIAWTRIFS